MSKATYLQMKQRSFKHHNVCCWQLPHSLGSFSLLTLTLPVDPTFLEELLREEAVVVVSLLLVGLLESPEAAGLRDVPHQ